jgi:hypothetical protein
MGSAAITWGVAADLASGLSGGYLALVNHSALTLAPMLSARSSLGFAGLALAAACAAPAPAELSGLWSSGQASCEAGVGVRFGADAIEIVYPRGAEPLFDRPRYALEREGEDFRVRIDYDLPHQAGGVASVGAHGVIVLASDGRGGIVPDHHMLVDPRTGAIRMRFVNDPAVSALTLQPCGARSQLANLRGRT